MRNYPYLWFANITRLLEKRDYHVVTIFLFALFVGSFRRFLEWTLGGVAEPFPLNFIVTLTGFYWFAFFLITLILRLLIKQPWRQSINVILVGIFLGIFPPVIDLLASGPGFTYAYVWNMPAKFNWYIYNPELNIPIGEAIVLWAVILLTGAYVRFKTQSWPRTLIALALAYLAVMVLGGVLAGSAKIIAKILGWQPTQQIVLLNILQILAPLAIYAVLQGKVSFRLAARVPWLLPYLGLYFLGAWSAGGNSLTVFGYAILLLVFLLIAEAVSLAGVNSETLDQEDLCFFLISGGMLLAALASGNAQMLLPLAMLYLTPMLVPYLLPEGAGKPLRDLVLRAVFVFATFSAGATATMENTGYGGPRWWIAFLPSSAAVSIYDGFDSLTLALLFAAVTSTLFLSLLLQPSMRTAASNYRRLPEYTTMAALLAVVWAGGARLFFDWAAAGEYQSLMLVSLLIVAGRYWLAFYVFLLIGQAVSGQPWRRIAAPALWLVPILGLVPPLLDGMFNADGALYRLSWNFPETIHWSLAYTEQGVTAGEAFAWWLAILLLSASTYRRTGNPTRTAAVFVLSYLAATLLGSGTAALMNTVRNALGWPEEHRIAMLAAFQFIAAFLVYGGLEFRVARGLAGRLPHVLPFLLIAVLGSAFYGGVSATTWAYLVFLGIAGWLALGQNDYFDAAEDALQGRAPYLDREDVNFLTVTSWFGVLALAAAHSGALFLAVMAAVSYMLYNFPFYRGKRYFPTNLKIEGVWGLCAFAFGLVAAYEQTAYGAPRWWVTNSPPLGDAALRGPFSVTNIAAMFLAFGGFSLVALLKDYKDWRSDAEAGVGTLYTLAVRRGWRFARVHRIALSACSAAVASAAVLMAMADKIPWQYAPGGLVAGAGVYWLMAGPASARRFKLTLLLLALYFVFLIVALRS